MPQLNLNFHEIAIPETHLWEQFDEERTLRSAGASLEVRPVGGNQRFTAVWQNKNELQTTRHAGLTEDLQRLSVEWVMRTRDGHAFGEVLMMGSVSYAPSGRSITKSF